MNERKLKILAAIMEEYVRTGEPVGSKAIASLPDSGVSAATVRNDMALLEQLGSFEQPLTSAGRVPTISGYRLYSEELMRPPALPDAERERLDEVDRLRPGEQVVDQESVQHGHVLDVHVERRGPRVELFCDSSNRQFLRAIALQHAQGGLDDRLP